MVFPADTVVMVCSFAANRDGVEGEPGAFDITAERGSAKPLTFGAGIHYCLGANLARAELQEALAFLPARMPGLALAGEPELGSIHGIYGLDRLELQVELGLFIFPTEYTIQPGRLARLAEERGFTRLFFPEHTHIPAARDTPYPAGGELPREYSHTYDPFVALAMAAAATERIKVGTGVCLVMERDPIVTAKEVASLDVLSGGRFLFGVGAGWNREEMANHGTDPRRRFSILRERVEAMKAIWTEDEASYAGEHVSFERIWSWPKPAQEPHPGDRRRDRGEGARPRARLRGRVDAEQDQDRGVARGADRGAARRCRPAGAGHVLQRQAGGARDRAAALRGRRRLRVQARL